MAGKGADKKTSKEPLKEAHAKREKQHNEKADAAFFKRYGAKAENPPLTWPKYGLRPAGVKPMSRLSKIPCAAVASVIGLSLHGAKTEEEMILLIRSALQIKPELRRLVVVGELVRITVSPTTQNIKVDGGQGHVTLTNPENETLMFWTARVGFCELTPDSGFIPAGGSMRLEITYTSAPKTLKVSKIILDFGRFPIEHKDDIEEAMEGRAKLGEVSFEVQPEFD